MVGSLIVDYQKSKTSWKTSDYLYVQVWNMLSKIYSWFVSSLLFPIKIVNRFWYWSKLKKLKKKPELAWYLVFILSVELKISTHNYLLTQVTEKNYNFYTKNSCYTVFVDKNPGIILQENMFSSKLFCTRQNNSQLLQKKNAGYLNN
jgi:hypothetical protein